MFDDRAKERTEKIQSAFNSGSASDIRHVLLGASTEAVLEAIRKDRSILDALKDNRSLTGNQQNLIVEKFDEMIDLVEKHNKGDLLTGYGLTACFAVGCAAWGSFAHDLYNADEPVFAAASAVVSLVMLGASGAIAYPAKEMMSEINVNENEIFRIKTKMLADLSM